jgi:hypothetical protein
MVGMSRENKLILQVLGAGRNDHLATREQRRNQIGIGLAGAGARFGDQHAVVGHRGGNALGQFELLSAQPIAGNTAGQRAIGREDFGKQGGHARIIESSAACYQKLAPAARILNTAS